jgi:myotubularin-related protein 6/7/8
MRCRDFNFMAFHFDDDVKARAVFENIRLLTCRLGNIDKLYAFNYSSNAVEREIKGWDLYNPIKEFERMGISESGTHKAWRISAINSKYEYCDTYPALLCVPTIISDTTLKHTASFRSKARIPALSYLHTMNGCTITRSAQPNVGVRLSRSAQDEKLVGAIFSSTKPSVKPLRSAPATPRNRQSTSDLSQIEDIAEEIESLNIPPKVVDDSIENISSSQSSLEVDQLANGKVYGAQQTNLIIDARPRVNAIANHAKGFGSERIEGYKGAEVRFLGIDNIHVMRSSLSKVVEALKDSDLTAFAPNRVALEKSGWRKHINYLLLGTRLVANTIAIQHSHVLIHCSDGWDRTSQLSALAQICLDPYYRTIKGFIVLVEKDWMSFGHMFRLRSGLLGHESWFEIENDRATAFRAEDGVTESEPATNAFETGFSKVQRFFIRRNEEDDADADPQPAESPARAHNTKVSEMSPVFHQFLDAIYQLIRQNPTRFEYNERFLRRLLYHVYSCQYGNFLCNSEKERLDNKIKDRTKSVWGYFLSRQSQFTNENFDPEINEKSKEKASLLEFNPDDIRWWYELYGRTDVEMNGTTAPPPPTIGDALDGTQSSNDSGEGSLESIKERAEFGTVSNVEPVGIMTGSSGAPSSSASTEATVPVTDAPISSSNLTEPTTSTSKPPVTNTNPLFARIEDNPSRPPLDSEDVTYLANMESPNLRTDPVTTSRSTTPRSGRAVAPATTIRDSSQDSRASGLFGKTKKEPLDVEMQ